MEKYLLAAKINYIYNVKQLIFGAGSVNKVGEEAERLQLQPAPSFSILKPKTMDHADAESPERVS